MPDNQKRERAWWQVSLLAGLVAGVLYIFGLWLPPCKWVPDWAFCGWIHSLVVVVLVVFLFVLLHNPAYKYIRFAGVAMSLLAAWNVLPKINFKGKAQGDNWSALISIDSDTAGYISLGLIVVILVCLGLQWLTDSTGNPRGKAFPKSTWLRRVEEITSPRGLFDRA